VRNLKERLLNKKAKIGIVGLGYVGLPLSIAFCKKNYKVTGIELDIDRINSLKKGKSYIEDVDSQQLRKFIKEGILNVSSDYRVVKTQDVIIICVPTPLSKTKEPDISYIISSINSIAENIQKSQLIILESTTYPGTTKEEILPLLESSGLRLDRDFYLAFSPERVDPGNKDYPLISIPKVLGAVSKKSLALAATLYTQVFDKVIKVSSSDVAEMAKLLENTFRSVNIGLINEITIMCDKLGIDVWEVIEAAKSKPFGFMPFYPGPGLGGHCLPTDPIYLSWRGRLAGFEARLIDLAQQVNNYMPEYVVAKISEALNKRRQSINSARILILGVSYKKNVADTRESPALVIISLLEKKGAKVSYSDPYVAEVKVDNKRYKSIRLNKKNLSNKDCVVIITDHSKVDYNLVAENSRLIVDTRNVLRDIKGIKNKVVKL